MPTPITHTCDRSDTKRCACARARATEQQRDRRRGDSARIRRDNLRRAYGITVEEYDALRAAQGYRCAICRRHEDEIKPHAGGRPRLDGLPAAEAVRLVVDHCHRGRGNRGLLCMGCNTALGIMDEDPERLRAAAAYVESWTDAPRR